jgi:hypothetical protein
MQVFINRAELAFRDRPMRVLGYHEDGQAIEVSAYGAQATVLSLRSSAITNTQTGPALMPGWREANREQVVRGEAARRILAVFPEHAQRNAALELGLMAAGGAKDSAKRKAEIERAWTYVNAVRQAAKAMVGALPADPTSDSHWPPRAAPFQG